MLLHKPKTESMFARSVQSDRSEFGKMSIRDLTIGQSARIETVGGTGALRQHFLDMGVIPGTVVTLIKLAPMGDPMELRIHGYELTLRVAAAGLRRGPEEAEPPENRQKRLKQAGNPPVKPPLSVHARTFINS